MAPPRGTPSKLLTGLLAAVLLLAGCAERYVREEAPPVTSTVTAAPPSLPSRSQRQAVPVAPPAAPAVTYIDSVVRETIAKFYQPGMNEYEMAKAAFDYIIDNTTLDDPVGLDLWRVRGPGDPQPGFVENRALSVLLYGVGMCEDYAAALTLLLRGMRLEAAYVPGLTYAADGSGLVDHAWTVARVDGVWYHLDCQLEQNVSRHGTVRYRFFMKGDGTLIASHRWGQNLIDARLLIQTQSDELAGAWIPSVCNQDWPAPPPPRDWAAPPAPDREALIAAAAAEVASYEERHGALSAMELDIIPPVFAGNGYPYS